MASSMHVIISFIVSTSFLAASERLNFFGFAFAHSLNSFVNFEQPGINLLNQDTIPRKL